MGDRMRRKPIAARSLSELTLPTFLIVGAMRAGTTALSGYLRDHPDVFISRRKELNFFDAYFDRGLDWYAQWFEGAGDYPAVGEATPSYMYAEEAAQRMATVLPDAKLVASLRNPVDRAYSHYWLNRARAMEKLSFADAVAAEPARLASGDWAARFSRSYLDRGRYLRQLQRLTGRYPRESLHVVVFEHLLERPEQVFGSLCRFIGVDDTFHPGRLGSAQAAFRTYRFKRLHRLSRRFPPRVRGTVRALNSRPASYPPLDPGFRAELVARFEEENQALESWLGIDLSAWRS